MYRERMEKRIEAAKVVAANWRIRRRLPRLTKLAVRLGLITAAVKFNALAEPFVAKGGAPMYRIYFTNHQYFSAQNYLTFQDAIEGARKHGFEVAIYQGAQIVAAWNVISGLRMVAP